MGRDDAIKDFPLGFVMAIPIFRIHPATWHCFGVFLYFVSEEYRDVWIICPGDVPMETDHCLDGHFKVFVRLIESRDCTHTRI